MHAPLRGRLDNNDTFVARLSYGAIDFRSFVRSFGAA
jgi:hypothetical protein